LYDEKKKSLVPIIHFFRYSEYLPKLTNGIYVARGNNSYYLNLFKNGKINEDDLAFLLNMIFGDKLDYILIENIYEFCNKISYDISPKVFDFPKHIFATPEYDFLIQKSLRSVLSSMYETFKSD
jgi:hypothetical protein